MLHSLSSGQTTINILDGLTVSPARLPEAVALVADIASLVGLYAAFIVGLITVFIGGVPE